MAPAKTTRGTNRLLMGVDDITPGHTGGMIPSARRHGFQASDWRPGLRRRTAMARGPALVLRFRRACRARGRPGRHGAGDRARGREPFRSRLVAGWVVAGRIDDGSAS